MTYRINGKKVTKDEFLKNSVGFDYSSKKTHLIGSFRSFISPIDGKEIKNRDQLSAHNREHGVEQVGHEFEGIVEKEKSKRLEEERA